MDRIERELWGKDFQYVAGIDEVGRGSLAGPVVAAAVIFNPDCDFPQGIDDSKKLTASVREDLYDQIIESAAAVGIGYVNREQIDKINILQATFKAMKSAVSQLEVSPDYLLIDGNRAPDFASPVMTVVKGDSKSFSIAAASIIAKVSRDRFMSEIDPEYSQYRFKSNKGYGTPYHIQAIREHGLSPQHRVTFCRKICYPQTDMWK